MHLASYMVHEMRMSEPGPVPESAGRGGQDRTARILPRMAEVIPLLGWRG